MDRTIQGRQPFDFQEYSAMMNGEIYNHKTLEKEFGIVPKGKSDCELLPELFSKVGQINLGQTYGLFKSLINNNK